MVHLQQPEDVQFRRPERGQFPIEQRGRREAANDNVGGSRVAPQHDLPRIVRQALVQPVQGPLDDGLGQGAMIPIEDAAQPGEFAGEGGRAFVRSRQLAGDLGRARCGVQRGHRGEKPLVEASLVRSAGLEQKTGFEQGWPVVRRRLAGDEVHHIEGPADHRAGLVVGENVRHRTALDVFQGAHAGDLPAEIVFRKHRRPGRGEPKHDAAVGQRRVRAVADRQEPGLARPAASGRRLGLDDLQPGHAKARREPAPEGGAFDRRAMLGRHHSVWGSDQTPPVSRLFQISMILPSSTWKTSMPQ